MDRTENDSHRPSTPFPILSLKPLFQIRDKLAISGGHGHSRKFRSWQGCKWCWFLVGIPMGGWSPPSPPHLIGQRESLQCSFPYRLDSFSTGLDRHNLSWTSNECLRFLLLVGSTHDDRHTHRDLSVGSNTQRTDPRHPLCHLLASRGLAERQEFCTRFHRGPFLPLVLVRLPPEYFHPDPINLLASSIVYKEQRVLFVLAQPTSRCHHSSPFLSPNIPLRLDGRGPMATEMVYPAAIVSIPMSPLWQNETQTHLRRKWVPNVPFGWGHEPIYLASLLCSIAPSMNQAAGQRQQHLGTVCPLWHRLP
mmetsp:Transcript_8699/g.20109  ORF Transcript_8699/g.20109 Transcript_8699/m.20109 type:complete len:307 (+) Transcript_8699:52-972(+)